MTKIVNCKTEKYDIFIGRPSKWGNPFRIGPDGGREMVIKKYEEYIRNKPELIQSLSELKGKTLGCFCTTSYQACHGEVLIKLIEEFCKE